MVGEEIRPANRFAGGLLPLQVMGVLVTFDDKRDPMADAELAKTFLDPLILVDNTPSGHPALRGITPPSSITVIANRNNGGLAGAYNAAIDRINIDYSDAGYVMFLDEDSDVDAIKPFLDSQVTREYLERDDVAAVAPLYIDRATGLPGAHIQLARLTYKILPRDLPEPTEVSFLINSMSLWKLLALRRIGRYNIALAVDHIDTDYCLRAKMQGYKLILNPTVKFWHSIGMRRQYRFFGWILQSGGHNSARREMIGRNTVILARHYGLAFPSFAILCGARLVYECIGILLVESNKLIKISALLKGMIGGLGHRYD